MAMLKFNVRMHFDPTMLREPCSKAEHVLAVQAEKDTKNYVPKRQGYLRLVSRAEGNKIIYPGPYARFLYNGVVMIDPTTGSSYAKKGNIKVVTDKPLDIKDGQDHWFEASKAVNMDKWGRVYKKAVAKYL